MATLRQRATERNLQALAHQKYPSPTRLNRLEESLRTYEDLDAYAELLLRFTARQRHPSPWLLDRLERCALVREVADARQLVASLQEKEDQDE